MSAVLRVASAPAGAVGTVSPSAPLAIPDIPATGASQGTWQVTLDDSAIDFCGREVVLEVEVTDDAGGNWLDTVGLAMDGQGTALIPDVDAVELRRDGKRILTEPQDWVKPQARRKRQF